MGPVADIPADSSQQALKEINVHLLQQISAKLKLYCQQEITLDFAVLQDVSDSACERCLLVLNQLQDKLVAANYGETVTPPPLNVEQDPNDGPLPTQPPASTSPDQDDGPDEFKTSRPLTPPHSPPPDRNLSALDWNAESTFALPTTKSILKPGPTTSNSAKSIPLVSAASKQTLTQRHQLEYGRISLDDEASRRFTPPAVVSQPRSRSRGSDESEGGAQRNGAPSSQYKPLATTTEKVSFFGIRKKRVEMVPDVPENPLIEKYLNEVIAQESKAPRSASPPATASRSSIKSQDAEQVGSSSTATDQDEDTNSVLTGTSTLSLVRTDSDPRESGHRRTMSKADMEVLASSRSLAAIRSNELLPNELNNFAGFCKGAWRQQIGDSKRAMEERVKPGSMYNTTKYWQCRHCKFEGRYVTPKNKGERGYDMRIAKLTPGIQFRWEFLFKSHIAASAAPVTDLAKGTYGCVFCCAEGRGSPVFSGIANFVRHLVDHRDRLPTGEVLYRMNCLVGKEANATEDFDINIVSRESSVF